MTAPLADRGEITSRPLVARRSMPMRRRTPEPSSERLRIIEFRWHTEAGAQPVLFVELEFLH